MAQQVLSEWTRCRVALTRDSTSSVVVAIRKERQETRALDRLGQLALVAGLRAGDAARHNLAGLADVLAQRVQILVVDLDDALGGEAAELLATEKFRHGGLAPGRFGFWGGGTRRAWRALAARLVVVGLEAEAFVIAAAAIALVVLVLQDERLLGDGVVAADD